MSFAKLVVRPLLFAVLLSATGARAEDLGPEINPFECYGRFENATGSRTIAQMESELSRLIEPLYKPEDPRTRRAVKACTVAKLKARVGHSDAYHYFKEAIRQDPEEPGYELWAGDYWTSVRGAFRPVHQKAEEHLYRALDKLEKLERRGKYRSYHEVVESWVRKRLLILYQEDGLPVLPWKAYPQHSSGLYAPGVTLSSQFAISRDTRDFFRNSEMRVFTAEAAFANSGLRAGGTQDARLTRLQRWNIVRAPLRYQVDNRVRWRQTFVGAFDVLHSLHESKNSQITSFYRPDEFNDVKVTELGVGYTRTLPLYPLFDLRLHGKYKRIHRTGVVEFLPEHEERFDFYELKPSISRFFGSDKLTLGLTYVFMDIPNLPGGGNPALSERGHFIRGAELGYALYSPLVLPSLGVGSFYGHRTPTRGWYFWAGFAESDQVYGLRTVIDRDYYLGTRFEGPGAYDFTLQGTLYTSDVKAVDPNDPALPEKSDPTQSFKSFRTSVIVQRRLIDADATPGLGSSALGFTPDMLNLVIPISWDKSLQGPENFLPSDAEDHGDDYESVRGGIELWFKVFATGLWGPALLFTAGYDVQYFYNLKRTEHLARANVRLGWGDFL